MGRSDFQRSKLVSFHNVGLADKNSSADEERGNKWKMRTASSLKNSLGHAKVLLYVRPVFLNCGTRTLGCMRVIARGRKCFI